MAERNPVSWVQAGSHSAEHDRQALKSIAPERGIVLPGDLLVGPRVAGGANMSVDIAAGSCYVMGTENPLQGIYHCINDGVRNLVLAASDPTNPRIDLIVARVRDAAYSGGTSAWALEVVQGIAAGSPVVPAVPANCLVLAQIAVAALQGSIVAGNIVDLRPLCPFYGRLVAQSTIIAAPALTASVNPVFADLGPTITFVMPYLASGQQLRLDLSSWFTELNANATGMGYNYIQIATSANVALGETVGSIMTGLNVALNIPPRAFITNATSGFVAGTRVTIKARKSHAAAGVASSKLQAVAAAPANLTAHVV